MMMKKRNIRLIVIHCTATSEQTAISSIQTYWKNVLHWRKPGYHYVVKANGEWVQLAMDHEVTNGVKGHNANAIHVAYVGGIRTLKNGKTVACDTRTEAQRKTLKHLVEKLKWMYPKALVVGHRDLSPDLNGNGKIEPIEYLKMCPCFNAIDEYGGEH